MCYLTIKGILGSCESLCLLPEFFCFWEKVKFFIFFIGWFLLLWDHCGIVVGSLWVVVGRCGIIVGSLWIVVGRCGPFWIVVGRCGSLWIIVGRCGSLWVVPGFSI